VICFPLLGRVGRLGNQLWQFAATVGIARARGTDPHFPAWPYQPWFDVPDGWFGGRCAGEDATLYAPHIDERARVYLQDYGLWRDVADEIATVLQPSTAARAVLNQFTEFWELPRPVLSVHVRRGDNVPGADLGVPDKHRYHPLRPVDYYRAAVGVLGLRAASVAVFSDDPVWCEDHLADLGIDHAYVHHGFTRPKENEAGYDEPPFDWIDLHLMAASELHVISNSTYAWWGAFLSGDAGPIYPWPWYGPALSYVDAGLMFPPTWRRLSHAA
jgi:hypothetical protein